MNSHVDHVIVIILCGRHTAEIEDKVKEDCLSIHIVFSFLFIFCLILINKYFSCGHFMIPIIVSTEVRGPHYRLTYASY